MKYRVIGNFRRNKKKYKIGEFLELKEDSAEELIKAGVIEKFEAEELSKNQSPVLDNLKKENAELKSENAKLKQEVEEYKEKIDKSGKLLPLAEHILIPENMEKMETSLIESIGDILGIEVEGGTKKEKAQSLYDQVTE